MLPLHHAQDWCLELASNQLEPSYEDGGIANTPLQANIVAVSKGIEPSSLDGQSSIIDHYTTRPVLEPAAGLEPTAS